jgi:hypothetical protein
MSDGEEEEQSSGWGDDGWGGDGDGDGDDWDFSPPPAKGGKSETGKPPLSSSPAATGLSKLEQRALLRNQKKNASAAKKD